MLTSLSDVVIAFLFAEVDALISAYQRITVHSRVTLPSLSALERSTSDSSPIRSPTAKLVAPKPGLFLISGYSGGENKPK